MSLLNKIENLQKRPEAVRRRILAVAVSFIMFVIVAAWVVALKISLAKENSPSASGGEIISPFAAFGGIVKDVGGFFNKTK